MTHWTHTLLAAPVPPAPCDTVAEWWPRHTLMSREWPGTMEQAIVGGFLADRVAWAFASAYQAALRALVPSLPDDSLACLCVTEADGNSPAAIRSELGRVDHAWFELNGAKKWTTLGPEGALFLVAARDASASTAERAALRVAMVPASLSGVRLEGMPPTKFVPEVPHAQIRFKNVRIPVEALLPGDGYERYVKPFRTVEDAHVTAGVVAYLVREARRLGWSKAWIERAVSVLLSLEAVGVLEPSSSATHVAIAGALSFVHELVAEAERLWTWSPADPAAARWERDRQLLNIASAARIQRIDRAWDRLSA